MSFDSFHSIRTHNDLQINLLWGTEITNILFGRGDDVYADAFKRLDNIFEDLVLSFDNNFLIRPKWFEEEINFQETINNEAEKEANDVAHLPSKGIEESISILVIFDR